MADINGVSSYRNTLTMPKAAPYGGGGGPDIDSTVTVKTGTSANQADLMGGVQFTIAASGNATKDLRADFLDADGNALSGMAELVELYIKASGNAAGVLQVEKAASNAFADLISGTTDNIPVGDGEELIKRNYDAGGIGAVSASLKDIKFTNADSSNTVTVTAWAVARSA